MQEIAPGLWHWSARHEHIGFDVSSYYLEPERVLIDAMIPPEGLGWFEGRAPEHVLLSNRHHDRHAWRLQDEFGCTVHCVRNGMHEIEGRGEAQPFDFGDTLPGGVEAIEIDAICPDEGALYIPSRRALVCADGVVRWPGREGIGFVIDELMDEPERTKAGLLDAYARVLDSGRDFDMLLLAHGDPVASGGREELRAFVESGA